MIFRLATEKDLPVLETMYKDIADNLTKNNIKIYWSEFYPYEEIEEIDIKNKTFYVLEENGEIVGGINLSLSHEKEKQINWKNKNAKAVYISKLGVNINFLKQGLGKALIENAKQLAKENGAEVLRLFVVDKNTPAINLYIKNGFEKADGKTTEFLEYHNVTLTEFGYEFKL